MDDSSRTRVGALRVDRRRFLRLGVLGGAASLLAQPAGTSWAANHNRAEALVLSCMDYRLTGFTTTYMAGRKLAKKYYQVMLAGASLAANAPPAPEPWKDTFWEHLKIAISLTTPPRNPRGPLNKVFVIDHLECGAYDLLLPGCCADPAKEKAAHAEQLKKLRTEINRRYDKMQVELLLMDLKGKVEPIA